MSIKRHAFSQVFNCVLLFVVTLNKRFHFLAADIVLELLGIAELAHDLFATN
jgi:hypothetical protein